MTAPLLAPPRAADHKPGSGRCIACGRRLIDPASRARGYGPVCGARMPLRDGGFFAQAAAGVIVVVDQQPRHTAAARAVVVQHLRDQGFNVALPILYRSTAGRWSRLRLPDRSTVEELPLAAVEYGDARLEIWRQTQGES